MIYFLYGSDKIAARTKARSLVDSLRRKKPDASYTKVTVENYDNSYLAELVGGMGLFGGKTIVEFDMVFRKPEAEKEISGFLKEMAASENIFVFLEGEIKAALLAKIKKNAAKVQEFSTSTVPKKENRSLFSLADALGQRDRKELWKLFVIAKNDAVAMEEIHGILFWQLKAMIQASRARSAAVADLNPYVYQKSGRYAQNFTPPELEDSIFKLITLYHEARRGRVELTDALEQFILEV